MNTLLVETVESTVFIQVYAKRLKSTTRLHATLQLGAEFRTLVYADFLYSTNHNSIDDIQQI